MEKACFPLSNEVLPEKYGSLGPKYLFECYTNEIIFDFYYYLSLTFFSKKAGSLRILHTLNLVYNLFSKIHASYGLNSLFVILPL